MKKHIFENDRKILSQNLQINKQNEPMEKTKNHTFYRYTPLSS